MKKNHSHWKKSQGTAIFMALLIIAIVATIAIVLTRSQQLNIRRTQMMLVSEQAYLYAQGVVDWAIGELITELRNPKASTQWPLVLPPTPIANGQGTIAGTLQDAQGLFNINNFTTIKNVNPTSETGNLPGNANTSAPGNVTQNPLASASGANAANNPANPTSITDKNTGISASSNANEVFINLLNALNIQLSPVQQKNLIAAITAWISASNNVSPTLMDPFDQQYAQMNPPYRSPHAPMVSVSELRTVAGVTPRIYNSLLPYITALPGNNTLNVLHAPPLLQRAMGIPGNNGQNTSQTGSSAQTGDSQAKTSNYFLLRADVYLQDQHLILYSMLQKNSDPKLPPFTILWRSMGTE